MPKSRRTRASQEPKRVTRRKFITGLGSGLIAGGIVGAATGALEFPRTVTAVEKVVQQPWLPATWDQEADVVVVGYGGAGAVTAITAHDAGANVLVIEKTPSLASLGVVGQNISGGGGNTHINGGLIVVPSDVSNGAIHARYLSWGTTPMAVCQAWAELANQIPAYLDNLGLKYNTQENTGEMANLPGASSITTCTVNGGGAALFHALDQAVQSRKIPVMFNTSVTDLIQDPDTKEVLGVAALSYPTPSPSASVWREPTSGGTVVNIKANKAVVLCSGGLEYNDQMKASFLKMYPAHFYGWIYNTGDGVRMASEAGADLWHLNMFSGRCVPWFPDNDMAYGYFINTSHPMILTDKYGKRYADESSTAAGHNWWVLLDDFNINVPEYTRIPTFLVFDETFRTKNGPISSYGGVALPQQLGGLKWSSDNSAEITKGYIQQGNTPAELAAAINQTKYVGWNTDDSVSVPSGINVHIDPDVLTATITNYNDYCAARKDSDFGRNPKTLLPLSTPPYYALPLWPGGPNTQGGPVRNENAQVLGVNGNPIPRLYSAGELGSIWGLYPTGGGNNSELIVFGQVAGKNAAAETAQT
jgi:succinate dehydrogenase/fumarate reductase flavoprotein subunit